MKAFLQKYSWILATIVGSAVFAFGFAIFLQPHHMNAGGISGLAQVFVELTGVGSVGALSILINLPLFVLGGMKIGKRFFFGSMIGMVLIRTFPDGHQDSYVITETEAYCGASDSACYAYKGRNKTSELLYHDGGTIFVHRCYGIHWMLNIVTGETNEPEAVLIRACEGKADGPGKLTKALGITGQLNRGSILEDGLWIEDDGCSCGIRALPRVGIGYASEEDQARLWRFQKSVSN